jgi:hypothetical protein
MINGRAVQNTDARGLRIGSVTAFGGVPARNGQNAEFGIFQSAMAAANGSVIEKESREFVIGSKKAIDSSCRSHKHKLLIK